MDNQRPLVTGLHHITAIASSAQRTVDFYVGVLGLRLVKQTVNGADREQLHLFFGDENGSPGSVITHFIWPEGNPAQHGVGEVAVTSFSIGPRSMGFWLERLVQRGIPFEGPHPRQIGESPTEYVLAFRDPDGLMLELVSPGGSAARFIPNDDPTEHAIRGLHSVTLWVKQLDSVAPLLTDTLGFQAMGTSETTHRFVVGDGSPSQIVDVREIGGFVDARSGVGGVDHVAWTVHADDMETLAMRLGGNEASVSGIVDRHYFTSLYARDANEILHEFATPGPGFTTDEPLEHLGEQLMLPAEWEALRSYIVAKLPDFALPRAASELDWFATAPEGDALVYEPYEYAYESGDDPERVLLTLHGTGGDEGSLLPLAASIAPGIPTISPRGKVLEGGSARRFFRRFAEGQLDQEDLRFRTAEMNAFVRDTLATHALTTHRLFALGFSNGANLAASMLLRGDSPLTGAILLSPMLPFEPETLPDLAGVEIFIGAGRLDRMVPFAQAESLVDLLRQCGASVTLFAFDGGHTVTSAELDAARTWFAER